MVTKTDAITHAPLAGAIFRVFNQTDPKNTVANLTTNSSGSDQANLPVGPTYCLEETTAPQGYQLPPTYTPATGCVPLNPDGTAATISATDLPSPTPSPTPTPTPAPTPTPTPTPGPTGELQVVKTDPAGQTVTAAGFTFNLHAGSSSGPVVEAITTDTSGTAIAAALSPATYCLEETAAPDGFQVAPTYSPGACVTVPADPTKGSNPATVTVADPASPSPSAAAASSAAARPPPSAGHLASPSQGSSASTAISGGSIAVALIAFGTLLLVTGLLMIAVDVSRRRRLGIAIR
jgi:uncharacterized surface anchored protein